MITLKTDCYVCGGDIHPPTTSHLYWSNRDADKWFAMQPEGSTPHCDETLRFPGED